MLHSSAPTSSAPPSSPPCSLIDDSLTDIRWLGSMDGRMNFPSMEQSNYRQRQSNHLVKPSGKGRICKKLNYSKKDPKTDAHKIRPPFSYAALIALAINSDPQKMLTLNNIYQWIENNFPFFRMPEARAWKNSIRHNLSIKKNLFQKVYIDPPRRGNGAYWTLLAEGTDEVERCMKLFTTLRPPIIDKSSVYCVDNNPSQQVVRSRGQFIPAVNEEDYSTDIYTVKEECEEEDDDEGDNCCMGILHNETLSPELPILPAQSVHCLRHPLEYHQEYPRAAYPPSIQPFNGPTRSSMSMSVTSTNCNLHANEHSNSSFPDLSFMTPMKTDLFSDGILLSPLTNNASVTPQAKRYSNHQGGGGGATCQSYSPLCTPLKPFIQEPGSDSGVFSPSNLQFYTPIKDIGELLQLNTRETDLYNQFESTPYPITLPNKSLLCNLDTNVQF